MVVLSIFDPGKQLVLSVLFAKLCFFIILAIRRPSLIEIIRILGPKVKVLWLKLIGKMASLKMVCGLIVGLLSLRILEVPKHIVVACFLLLLT